MIYSNKLLLLSMRKIRRESQVNLQNMSFIKIDTLLSNPSPLQSISSRDFKTLHSNSHSFALNSHIGSRTNLPHVNSESFSSISSVYQEPISPKQNIASSPSRVSPSLHQNTPPSSPKRVSPPAHVSSPARVSPPAHVSPPARVSPPLRHSTPPSSSLNKTNSQVLMHSESNSPPLSTRSQEEDWKIGKFTSYKLLFTRIVKCLKRDRFFIQYHLISAFALSLSIGLFFIQLKPNTEGIHRRYSVIYLTLLYIIIQSYSLKKWYDKDIPIFIRDHHCGFISSSQYFFVVTLLDSIFNRFLPSLLYVLFIYC